MREKIDVRGVRFDNVTPDEASEIVKNHINNGHGCMAVFTPNSEIVQGCIERPDHYEIINSAELIIPDGIGVVKASKILGTPLKCRVTGFDLGESVIRMSAEPEHGWKIYFLGGKPDIAELAAEKMREKYPKVNFCGMHDGFFSKSGEENEKIKEDIRNSGADILFVCFGAPAQEKWVFENRKDLPDIKLMLALGGSIDGYAGVAKRAPKIFIKLGLEWLYRLICDPKRIRRMMKLPKFYFGTWRYKLSKR